MVVGGAGTDKHTHAHTHSFPRDTQCGWSLIQGSKAIFTHASVAPPLIKLMGYEHREDAMEGREQAMSNTHTHTHTHTHRVSHRMDGASSKDRTQS